MMNTTKALNKNRERDADADGRCRWTMDDGRWTMDDGRWTMDNYSSRRPRRKQQDMLHEKNNHHQENDGFFVFYLFGICSGDGHVVYPNSIVTASYFIDCILLLLLRDDDDNKDWRIAERISPTLHVLMSRATIW